MPPMDCVVANGATPAAKPKCKTIYARLIVVAVESSLTLPLSRDDTYRSTAVSKILSPTGKGHRSIAQHRRRANELLGLKIGNQYRYPKFQIDPLRHEIRPSSPTPIDAWNATPIHGTLDWWYSEDEALGSRRPVDLLGSGELTRESVDFAIKRISRAWTKPRWRPTSTTTAQPICETVPAGTELYRILRDRHAANSCNPSTLRRRSPAR